MSEAEPPSPLVPNEQAKLTATYLNGIAIAILAVGGLAPIVAMISGGPSTASPGAIAALGVVCVGASLALDVLARRYLRELRP